MTAKAGRGLSAGLFRLLRHDLLHLPALLQLVMALWCRFSLGLDPDNDVNSYVHKQHDDDTPRFLEDVLFTAGDKDNAGLVTQEESAVGAAAAATLDTVEHLSGLQHQNAVAMATWGVSTRALLRCIRVPACAAGAMHGSEEAAKPSITPPKCDPSLN
jgi:hypothetical protein